MKKIALLIEYMKDELHDAQKYAEAALLWKDEDRDLARTFYDKAGEEIGHAECLHKHAVKAIKEHREKNGEPPAAMLAVWEWEHKKFVEQEVEINGIMARFDG